MIQAELKLKLKKSQEALLTGWLWNLTGVWNWAIKRIEVDAKDKIYHSPIAFQNLLSNHGKKMGIPSHTMQGVLASAHAAWTRCFKKIAKKPRFKGIRNRMTSIPFPDPIMRPKDGYISLPILGKIKFHKQKLKEGKIKCGRIVKRASGWYLCLFIDAEINAIPRIGYNQVGIDPGFKSLLTLSNGEKIAHPRELEAAAARLGQAQRGRNKKLAARLQERIANRRKDRNHKLSRRLVSENALIAFSADNHKGVSSKFGKGVSSSSHGQLRQMLSYKSPKSGTEYIEVDPKNSTKSCSSCGVLSGPTGWNGLAVRHWDCEACGAHHDRDINAAINTLNAALGSRVEEIAA
ncbi:MAG: transposase [Bacteroidetes bacterium]|nr:transposase [Bacteroidota bacterium]